MGSRPAFRDLPAMEVKVTDTFGLEDDVLVSIRYGTVRFTLKAPFGSVWQAPSTLGVGKGSPFQVPGAVG